MSSAVPEADTLSIEVPPESAVHEDAPTSSSTVATSIPDDPPQQTVATPAPIAEDTTPHDEFDWPTYLVDTQTTAAPDTCFAQSMQAPPKNAFDEGMKLEMRDPRGGRETICLACVESTFEVWLCTRLEGCDNSNDRWIICDHEDLLTVGFAASLDSAVSPPIGYMFSMAKHKQFVASKLQDASMIAPADCFRPLSPTLVPAENTFQVGQKLESVDIKNFNGSLYPSTITNIDGDMLDVSFDGYSHGYNIKVRFDSRNIFPVGWGARAGVPVTRPPKLRPSKKAAKRSVPVDHPPTTSKRSKADHPTVAAIKTAERPRSRTKKSAISPVPKTASRSSSTSSKPTPVVVKTEESMLTVYTNSECACGPWLEPSKLTASYGHLVIGPYSIMHGVREVYTPQLQMIINCAMDNRRQKVLEMFGVATSDALPAERIVTTGVDEAVTVTADINGVTSVLTLPAVPDTASAWRLIDVFLDHLHTCPRLLSQTDAPCADCGRRVEPGTTNAPEHVETLPPWTDADTNRVIRWSVEEVAKELAVLEDETVIAAIRLHAIDGQALFLLNTELMVKYMGLKLGPALKVSEWRNNFKKGVTNRRQQR